jgi:hypothetical protein
MCHSKISYKVQSVNIEFRSVTESPLILNRCTRDNHRKRTINIKFCMNVRRCSKDYRQCIAPTACSTPVKRQRISH